MPFLDVIGKQCLSCLRPARAGAFQKGHEGLMAEYRIFTEKVLDLHKRRKVGNTLSLHLNKLGVQTFYVNFTDIRASRFAYDRVYNLYRT